MIRRLFNSIQKHPRVWFVAAVAVYCIVFIMTYELYVLPTYDAWGFSHNEHPSWYLSVFLLLAIIPSVWKPLDFYRPSQLLFLIQYFIIYIPSLYIVYHTSNPELSTDEALFLSILMFAGLSIIQAVYYMPLKKIRFNCLSADKFWILFTVSMIGLFVYIIWLLGGNFRFANLEEIYDVRSLMSEIVASSGSRLGFYAQMWLAGFFLPFCIANWAFTHKKKYLIIAGVGYLILFGVGGSKTTLFASVYIFLVYLWVRNIGRHSQTFFAFGLCLILLAGKALQLLGLEKIAFWYKTVVNFRTFAVPQLTIPQYFKFFENHPLTYLSHITGFNYFIKYPYSGDIPRYIGEFYYGSPVGANAGFWAGDGITAFGPYGIIVMSFVCALLFWLVDCISEPFDSRFVMIAITFIATSFTNISLSTTLVSGGLGLLLLSLLVIKNEGSLAVIFRTQSSKIPGSGKHN